MVNIVNFRKAFQEVPNQAFQGIRFADWQNERDECNLTLFEREQS